MIVLYLRMSKKPLFVFHPHHFRQGLRCVGSVVPVAVQLTTANANTLIPVNVTGQVLPLISKRRGGDDVIEIISSKHWYVSGKDIQFVKQIEEQFQAQMMGWA